MDRVDQLLHFLQESNLIIEVIDHDKEFDEISFRNLKVTTGQKSLIVPVSDEYKDVELNIPALWLHLILETCECYEECKDYAEWRIEFEVPDSNRSKLLYEELRNLVAELRKIIGYDLKAISPVEISLGSGLAQKIRNLGKQ